MKPFIFDPNEVSPKEIACHDDGEWPVEAILNHAGDTTRKSTMDFLVKWTGVKLQIPAVKPLVRVIQG